MSCHFAAPVPSSALTDEIETPDIQDVDPQLLAVMAELLDEVLSQPPYGGGPACDASNDDEYPVRIEIAPIAYASPPRSDDLPRDGWAISAIDERSDRTVGFTLFFPEEVRGEVQS